MRLSDAGLLLVLLEPKQRRSTTRKKGRPIAAADPW
jgi:hypothetical protein